MTENALSILIIFSVQLQQTDRQKAVYFPAWCHGSTTRNFLILVYKFGQLYINKLITNAKLHIFQQIDQRKKPKSVPKFR